MSAKEVILYDPTAEPRILAAGLARRLDTLRGGCRSSTAWARS